MTVEAKERHVEGGGTAQLERALAERETAFRCLLECASDAYLVYDGEGLITDVNERAGEAWRLPDSALRGRSLADLVDSEQAEAELISVDAAAGGPRTVGFLGRCRDGESFRAEARVGLLDPDGPTFMALVRDVSDRERAERQLRFLESHDPLTGLPNCKLLLDQARAACARAEAERRQVAVLHVDLNRFRLINQGLGSEGGDELLRQVSSRPRGAARPMDVVARYSADEFLLLAPDLEWESPDQPGAGAGGVAAAHSLAERIHGSLERPFDLGGREIYVDAAVGVSLFPVDADGPEGLLRHADAAAQQAKRPADGPTKLFAGETSDKWARLWLATRLRKAVEREELLLHYQPIVALESVGASADGDLAPHIVAVEALVRWCDSDGIVPPAGFIPLAEDLGIIESIGEWVLAEACRQTAGWRSRGADLQVSFNLSVQELWQEDVVTRIAGQVRESGLEPGSVIVEVTESSAMTDPVRAIEVLGGLRDAGLTIAMDDFGAGYSSLGRLSDFPCEILKIDRSFVSRLPEDPGAAAMVTAMVELAKGIGMRTVAEGIETPEQLAVLRERGCELGQGYLFSRPVPPQELPLS